MKVPNTDANMKRCICGDCPTFVKGDKGLFCALGTSDLELTDRGCICGACPLWSIPLGHLMPKAALRRGI